VQPDNDLDADASDHHNQHQEQAAFGKHALSPDLNRSGSFPAGFAILGAIG
jgi:hypothetical protein